MLQKNKCYIKYSLIIILVIIDNMKAHKNQLKTKYQNIISKLKQRLCLDHIYREFQLIANMNKHLQIKMDAFQLLEPLKTLDKDEVIYVISCIPFLKYYKKQIAHVQHQFVQLAYPNDLKTLLVTGIQEKSIQKMLLQYNQNMNKKIITPFHDKFHFAKITHNNGFWVSVETNNQEIAFYLKKFLRNYKRSMDESDNKHLFRIQRRRIRIIILKQDLFTLLIDAMTEIKAHNFAKQFIYPINNLQKRNPKQLPQIKKHQQKCLLMYKPLLAHLYHNYGRSQIKDQQLSDGFSESNSLNSDILDSNILKDLIQTSDQGIQAQNYEDFSLIYRQNANKNEDLSNNNSPLREDVTLKQNDKQSFDSLNIVNPPQEDYEKIQQNIPSQFIMSDKLNLLSLQKQNTIAQGENGQDQPIDLDKQKDDPFIRIPKPIPGYSNYSTAIQTYQKIFSQIPFMTMKRFYSEFKRSKKSSILIQLPDWVKSESEQERSRHRYYQSLCRPNKIIQKKAFIQ